MTDRKLFYDDPSVVRHRAKVIEAGEADDRIWLRLDATIFYPEGGGQPSDRGTIAGVAVADVRSRGDHVIHLLDDSLDCAVGDEVDLALDAARRFDHCQQHTAQHLVSAILEDRHALPTTSFHLGVEVTAIEIPGGPPSVETLRRFEDEINDEIRRDRAVRTRWVEPGELGSLPVRSRGLPEGHRGLVRLVEVEGVDLNTCGGTHVARLAEIQLVHLLGAEPARNGGSRLHFVAGNRVRANLRRHESLAAELTARIGTSPREFASVIDGWQAERKRLDKRAREMERALAIAIAAEISKETGPRFVRVVPIASPDMLRAIAAQVLEHRNDGLVILAGTSGDPPEACFLVQAGAAGIADVASIGDRVRSALGAKGGGKGKSYQGKGGTLDAAAFMAATREAGSR